MDLLNILLLPLKILFFPFILAIKIVEGLLKITGTLFAIALGFIIAAVGALLTVTIIGAIIGIPLIILGVVMIIKSIF